MDSIEAFFLVREFLSSGANLRLENGFDPDSKNNRLVQHISRLLGSPSDENPLSLIDRFDEGYIRKYLHEAIRLRLPHFNSRVTILPQDFHWRAALPLERLLYLQFSRIQGAVVEGSSLLDGLCSPHAGTASIP